MVNMNKITKTRVGDEINYFVNGVEGSGTVVKMSNSYVTVLKSGKYEHIPLNDTFFVKDIVVNKTWDSMDDGERLETLSKAHAPSPRYVTKTWDQLPKELQAIIKNNSSNVSAKDGKDDDMNVTHRTFDKSEDVNKDSLLKIEDEHDKNTKVEVLDEWKNDDNDSGEDKKKPSKLEKAIEKLNQLKSNVETSVHGNAGRYPNSGVSTSISHDAPKDYEGASHSGIRLEQFKHENKKPQVKKEQVDLGDTKPTDVHDGGNKYDTKTQPKTINGRAADQEKDKKI